MIDFIDLSVSMKWMQAFLIILWKCLIILKWIPLPLIVYSICLSIYYCLLSHASQIWICWDLSKNFFSPIFSLTKIKIKNNFLCMLAVIVNAYSRLKTLIVFYNSIKNHQRCWFLSCSFNIRILEPIKYLIRLQFN